MYSALTKSDRDKNFSFKCVIKTQTGFATTKPSYKGFYFRVV